MLSPQNARFSLKFSTQDLPETARAKALRDLYEQAILPGKLEPLEPLPGSVVRVDITKWTVAGVSVMSGALAGVRQVIRSASSVASCEDDVLLGVNLRGGSIAIYHDQEFALRSGDAFFATRDAKDVGIARSTAMRFMGFRVARNAVAALGARLGEGQFRIIRRGTPALDLLIAYTQAAASDQLLGAPQLQSLVATHITDLIGANVGGTRDGLAIAENRGIRAARMQAIMADLVANMERCDLTVDAIARRQRVTTRYIHKLFEGEGTTFSTFLREQRLCHAHRMLCDTRLMHRSISSIAYDVGFGDLSYFNRVFRQRYSATPSEVRHSSVGDATGGGVTGT